MKQLYWNLNNLKNFSYPAISVNYSDIQEDNISMKDLINVLKIVDMYFAYRGDKLKDSDSSQMEKEIEEYEKNKFGVVN